MGTQTGTFSYMTQTRSFHITISSVLLLSNGFETGTVQLSHLICNKLALCARSSRDPLSAVCATPQRPGCRRSRLYVLVAFSLPCVLRRLSRPAQPYLEGRSHISQHTANAVYTVWGYVTVIHWLQAVAADAGRARMRWSQMQRALVKASSQ